MDGARDRERLLARLDRARAGDQAERRPAADLAPVDVEHRRAVVDELGGGELVGPRDRHDPVDARHALEAQLAHARGIADRPDRRRQLAGHDDDVDAGRGQPGADRLDLGLAGGRLHDDHHGSAEATRDTGCSRHLPPCRAGRCDDDPACLAAARRSGRNAALLCAGRRHGARRGNAQRAHGKPGCRRGPRLRLADAGRPGRDPRDAARRQRPGRRPRALQHRQRRPAAPARARRRRRPARLHGDRTDPGLRGADVLLARGHGRRARPRRRGRTSSARSRCARRRPTTRRRRARPRAA